MKSVAFFYLFDLFTILDSLGCTYHLFSIMGQIVEDPFTNKWKYLNEIVESNQ